MDKVDYDLLSKEEFADLLVKAKSGDIKARNRIVDGNIRMVFHYVGTLRLPPFVDSEDLVSIGILAVIDAIDMYDPNLGAMFSTYVYVAIRNSVMRYLSKYNNNGIISLCDYSEDVVSDDQDELLTYGDIIPDTHDIQDAYDDKDLINKLYRNFDYLDFDTKKALKFYFGFSDGDKHTIKETAEIMQLTYGKVRRMINNGVSKLRELMYSDGYYSSNTTNIKEYCKKYF